VKSFGVFLTHPGWGVLRIFGAERGRGSLRKSRVLLVPVVMTLGMTLWSRPTYQMLDSARRVAQKQALGIQQTGKKLRLGLTQFRESRMAAIERGRKVIHSPARSRENAVSPTGALLNVTATQLRERGYDQALDLKRDGVIKLGRIRVNRDRILDPGVREQLKEEVRRLESDYQFESNYSLLSGASQQRYLQRRADLAKKTMMTLQRYQGDQQLGLLRQQLQGIHPWITQGLTTGLGAYSLMTGQSEYQFTVLDPRLGVRVLTHLPQKRARLGVGARLDWVNTELALKHEAGQSFVDMQISGPCFFSDVVCSVESSREIAPTLASAPRDQEVIRIRYDLRF